MPNCSVKISNVQARQRRVEYSVTEPGGKSLKSSSDFFFVDGMEVEQTFTSAYWAPKVRNGAACGNAPGNLPANTEALKARNKKPSLLHSSTYYAPSALDHNSTVNLGRWPRLLHHAPLALNASNNFVDESSMSLLFTVREQTEMSVPHDLYDQ